MVRKALTLTAIILVFWASQVQAEVIHSTWVGGEYGEWGNPENWNPAIVPDNNDLQKFFVTIDSNYAGVNAIEFYLQQDREVNQVDCNGTVELLSDEGSMLRLMDSNGLRNYGGLEIDEVSVEGYIKNYGYLELADLEVMGDVTNESGGRLEFEFPGAEINGNLYNLAGGTVRVGSWAEIKQGDIENAGTIVIYPLGQMMFENQFGNNGEILLYGGSLLYWEEEYGPGVLDNNSPGVITGFGIVEANQSIQNRGIICASSGPLLLYSKGSLINSGTLKNDVGATLHIGGRIEGPGSIADVNNQGTIEVNADGAVVFDCYLNNEPNATIHLLGGTLGARTITQSAGATCGGFGATSYRVPVFKGRLGGGWDPGPPDLDPPPRKPGITIDPNGLIELTGPTNIVGDVNIPANATLEISDGTTLITGDCECNYGTIHMKGGRIIIQGVFSNNNCRIIWEPGTYTNVADFNLDGTVNFKDFADFANTWLWQADWYTP